VTRRRFNQVCVARDGVRLLADVYLPDGDGAYPTVLGRTPYGKNNPGYSRLIDAWNSRGYALAIQDVRGRGDSDGTFTPYRNESLDGADAVAWVASQPWSSGEVIVQGASYGARSAWLTALAKPPALRALIVLVSPSDPFVEDPTCVHSPMSVSWFRLVDGRAMQGTDGVDWMQVYEHLPLLSMDERAGFHSAHWREDLEHPPGDDGWWEPLRYQAHFADIDLPVLHVSGWYDDEQIGTPLNFAGMVRSAPSQRARSMQRMVMGPWGHAVNAGRKLGEVDFGAEAVIDMDGRMAAFADAVLGRSAPLSDAPVRIFVMGANVWRDEREWPLARTRFTDFFLHSGGNANSRFGDGVLSIDPPTASEPADTYLHDPARPVPFLTDPTSSQIGGPDDYAAVEQRGDVLCYTTPPLDADTEVTGPIRLVLHASSSAVDTDFTAKLVDVHPGGFCQRLCDGVVRARYREGFTRESPLQPGTVHEVHVDMWNTCQVFMAGHRIRLEVASSAFPKYSRNLNTGEPAATATRMVVAENRVWHDPDHPSRLVLPLIPA
jgi:putative CocE/NonD family hydrolase